MPGARVGRLQRLRDVAQVVVPVAHGREGGDVLAVAQEHQRGPALHASSGGDGFASSGARAPRPKRPARPRAARQHHGDVQPSKRTGSPQNNSTWSPGPAVKASSVARVSRGAVGSIRRSASTVHLHVRRLPWDERSGAPAPSAASCSAPMAEGRAQPGPAAARSSVGQRLRAGPAAPRRRAAHRGARAARLEDQQPLAVRHSPTRRVSMAPRPAARYQRAAAPGSSTLMGCPMHMVQPFFSREDERASPMRQASVGAGRPDCRRSADTAAVTASAELRGLAARRGRPRRPAPTAIGASSSACLHARAQAAAVVLQLLGLAADQHDALLGCGRSAGRHQHFLEAGLVQAHLLGAEEGGTWSFSDQLPACRAPGRSPFPSRISRRCAAFSPAGIR